MIKLFIEEKQANKRVDIALSEISEFSRSMVQKIIIAGNLYCNGEKVRKANKKTQMKELYELIPIRSTFTEITAEKYDLDILFEDEYLIVINKPADLVVHPGAGHFNNTLINKLAYHCTLSDINGPEKLGTVHRLDKGVSGCIIFAKDNLTHMHINHQFANREIKKTYYALSHGTSATLEWFVKDYIARSKNDRKKMAIHEKFGKIALMNFSIKKVVQFQKKTISLIECNPITGRMHQIRVQLANKKLPILNDKIYGKKEDKEIKTIFNERIALHSKTISFIHPRSNVEITIDSGIPDEFFKIISNNKD